MQPVPVGFGDCLGAWSGDGVSDTRADADAVLTVDLPEVGRSVFTRATGSYHRVADRVMGR